MLAHEHNQAAFKPAKKVLSALRIAIFCAVMLCLNFTAGSQAYASSSCTGLTTLFAQINPPLCGDCCFSMTLAISPLACQVYRVRITTSDVYCTFLANSPTYGVQAQSTSQATWGRVDGAPLASGKHTIGGMCINSPGSTTLTIEYIDGANNVVCTQTAILECP